MLKIAKLLKIHPLTVEDCLQEDPTREKYEAFDNYLFMVCKEEEYQTFTNSLHYRNINFLIFSSFIISIHKEPIQLMNNVIFKVLYLKDPLTNTPDWIMYAFLDAFTDALIERARSLEKDSFTLKQLVNYLKEQEQERIVSKIDLSIQNLFFLRTFVHSRLELVKGLLLHSKESGTFISKANTRVYLRDLYDHLQFIIFSLDETDNILQQLRGGYVAQVSIQMLQVGNELNYVIKKFGAVATILLPMIFVVGLMAMNIKVPFRDVDSLYAFWGISAGFIVFTVVSIFYFWKWKWI